MTTIDAMTVDMTTADAMNAETMIVDEWTAAYRNVRKDV